MSQLPAFHGDLSPVQYHLLHSLYVSVSTREDFDDFVVQLSRCFQAASVTFAFIHPDTGKPRSLVIVGAAEKLAATPFYGEAEIFRHRLNELEKTVLAHAGFVIASRQQASCNLAVGVWDVLKQWVIQHNLVDSASLVIKTRLGMQGVISLQRDKSAGYFSEDDVKLLNSIVPYIEMALDIHEQKLHQKQQLKQQGISIEQIRSFLPISFKEAQVCQLLLKGLALKTIAAERGVSLNTVREQVRQIYQKTGFKRQHELVTAIWGEFR